MGGLLAIFGAPLGGKVTTEGKSALFTSRGLFQGRLNRQRNSNLLQYLAMINGIREHPPAFGKTFKDNQTAGATLIFIGTVLMINAVILGPLISRNPLVSRSLAIKVGVGLGVPGCILTALGLKIILKRRNSLPEADVKNLIYSNLRAGMTWAAGVENARLRWDRINEGGELLLDEETVCGILLERLNGAASLAHYVEGLGVGNHLRLCLCLKRTGGHNFMQLKDSVRPSFLSKKR